MTIAERVLTAKPGDQVVMEAYINHLSQIAGKSDRYKMSCQFRTNIQAVLNVDFHEYHGQLCFRNV